VHGTLPLIGEAAPRGAGLRGTSGALAAAGSLAHAAAAHPALLLETGILGVVAFALPYCLGRSPRSSVALGAGMLGAMLLALPGGAFFSLAAPLVACSAAIGAFSALGSR